MLKIGVCDDDLKSLESIQLYINTYFSNNLLEYTLQLYSNGYKLLSNCFDIIFLDFDMPKINGYELASKIRTFDTNVKIVYITNYVEYKDLAFSVHAFDYLTKPINEEKIFNILDELIRYQPFNSIDDNISFKFNTGIMTFKISELLYFEYFDRNVYLHTKIQKYILHKEKISNIANKMLIHNFYVSHKSFVVNISNVKFIKGYNIYITNGDIIPLSQKYSTSFRKNFDTYLRSKLDN